MELYTNNYYSEDINNVCKLSLPWDELRGKSIMLSGATGLIGSFFVDVISEKNITDGLNCTVGTERGKSQGAFQQICR